tara:strand:+ start:1705 stop:2466 length:762 start_codon:yes stop_codon:yes gene_type:complete
MNHYKILMFILSLANVKNVVSFINFKTSKTPIEFPYDTIEMSPYHPKIHGYSNIGFWGDIHAQGVPFATKVIDYVAYDNRDVRKEIAETLFEKVGDAELSVLDVGCSTGMFTECLWNAGFKKVAGLDASPNMLKHGGNRLPKEIDLYLGNAGLELPDADIYVCSFIFHELPKIAREAILKNVCDKLNENENENAMLLVVDIHQTYIPKEVMLSGEPFCLDYIKHFPDEINEVGLNIDKVTWIENHVQTWWCTK